MDSRTKGFVKGCLRFHNKNYFIRFSKESLNILLLFFALILKKWSHLERSDLSRSYCSWAASISNLSRGHRDRPETRRGEGVGDHARGGSRVAPSQLWSSRQEAGVGCEVSSDRADKSGSGLRAFCRPGRHIFGLLTGRRPCAQFSSNLCFRPTGLRPIHFVQSY